MATELGVSDVLKARKDYNAALASAGRRERATWFPLALLILLTLLPALQITGGHNYTLHLMLYAMMYAAMASSWNILGGYTGYISLGHNVFFCIGGYFSGMILAYFGVTSLLTAPFAGLAAAIVGFAVGLITLKMRGPTFIISSIALLMVARILFDHWQFVGGSNGVALPQMDIPAQWAKLPYYYGMMIVCALTVWASYRIKHSKFGLGLRAISQDEVKAESAGIDTRFYKVLAFAISAFFVGMAGAIWGEYITYLRPNIFLIILVAANMVLMCILGGKGTVAGPIVGAVVLIAFNEFSVTFFGSSEINLLITGLVMVLALKFFPAGIVGTLAKKGRLPRVLDWD
ncbi:branched-chain amino acid ABC transporter permease [Chelativorans salis]|uniref:Branched-chain amino acid ABC transporter permease n=1 Tax=Chelativorans salis TaxID=2978478 RepID=A0ABT2LVU3_9HYPH|nr:branched-chain amino acid ABC transporter permease [Chelativorans sp. EGI FJ00035]MCT7377698.1 branched-chain amino acid ABC transporter permease [Chelativorans sp. EGI FJ00035]